MTCKKNNNNTNLEIQAWLKNKNNKKSGNHDFSRYKTWISISLKINKSRSPNSSIGSVHYLSGIENFIVQLKFEVTVKMVLSGWILALLSRITSWVGL